MAIPAVTYTFTNGTTASGPNVSTNFSDLIASLTDGTKSLTIDALSCAGTITATGKFASDVSPSSDATRSLGTSSLNFIKLHLDNGATDGGAIYFNSGTTSFIKANAAGTILSQGGIINSIHAMAYISQAAGNYSVTSSTNVNVASVTKLGTGSVEVNFTTAFADSNYIVICTTLELTSNVVIAAQASTTTKATVQLRNDAGTAVDSSFYIMCVGNR